MTLAPGLRESGDRVDRTIGSPGREIFYQSNRSVVSVAVRTEPDLQAGSPQTLFELPSNLMHGNAGRTWDATPDGERFVIVVNAERDRNDRQVIQFVTSWTEELERLVPTEK